MSQIDRETIKVSTSSSELDEGAIENGNEATDHASSMCIRFDFAERRKAQIIFNTLNVDKEPKRSRTRRELALEGTIIVANFVSDDQKSLMRSANNFADMCQLARACIDTVSTYTYQPTQLTATTTSKTQKARKEERKSRTHKT